MQVRFHRAMSAFPSRRFILNKAMCPAPFRGLNLCLILLWALGLLTALVPAAFAQTTAAPNPPTNVHATGGTHQVMLSWDAPVSGANYYNIYKGTVSGSETRLPQGVTNTTYKDISVTNGTTYFYYVRTVVTSTSGGPIGVPPQPQVQSSSKQGSQKLRLYPHIITIVNHESSPSAEVNAVPLVRLNCGGADYTDGAGKVWNADQDFTGGAAITTTTAITGTADPTLYQAQRSGA